MPKAKSLLVLLLSAFLVTSVPPSPASTQTSDPIVYHGVLDYRLRGPAASPYGIGTSLLVGAGVPVAIARIQNILRNLFEVLSRAPGIQDEPSVATVTQWMDEGIPINLAEELPVTGAYEATVTFSLEATSDTTFELTGGTVRWRASNSLRYSDDGISLSDDFGGSGSHVLDPARDQITLTIDEESNPPMAVLEVEIYHPEPIDGKSEFTGAEGAFKITLEADNGEMVIDGAALGMPISAAGAPTPMTIVEDSGLERAVSYSRRAPLDEIHYHIEIWSDVFDNQGFAEYTLRTECQPRIIKPEPTDNLTYDDGDPGVLEFTAEAAIDAAGFDPMLEDLVWSFPEIPGSTRTSDPEDARGRQVTVRYEGLPAKNADFGQKRIEAHFDSSSGCEDPAPLGVRVFFPREASNNPGGTEPNWFYYWNQTRASQGHGDAIVYDESTPHLGYYLGFKITSEANRIYLGDLGESLFEETNVVTGKRTQGIDLFGSVVLHEWTHLENRHDWWPDGMDPARDGDNDWVPDDREADYGLDPQNRDTFGIGMRDAEIPAYLQEHTWANGSANSVDWADPGKQSGGGQ